MTRYMFAIAALAVLVMRYRTTDRKVEEKSSAAATGTIVDAVRDGVFIHITHSYDDPHRVVMPLRMATMMAGDKDVLVYFDIKGIGAVLKYSKDITYPAFPSAKESLGELLKKGIQIYACPGCMKAAGKTQNDLMPGVTLAEKEKCFGFTKGRILTLD